MPGCFFALLRFCLRVDGVEVRVRDTRLFHRFGSRSVVRDHCARRATYAELVAAGLLAAVHEPAPAPHGTPPSPGLARPVSPAAAAAAAAAAGYAAPDPAALADKLPIESHIVEEFFL
jgi:hypothetical protein